MVELEFGGAVYELSGAGVYYREADGEDYPRELVIKLTVDVGDIDEALLQSFHADHETKRDYIAAVGGVVYRGTFHKTTVTNQEYTDPQSGESQRQLEVALVADASQVSVDLEN